MLKPQDIMILLKMHTCPQLTQSMLAVALCISQSEVSAGRKRLIQAGLIVESSFDEGASQLKPVIAACEECLIHGVKYFFPAEWGTETPGIVTSYAAPLFKSKISLGNSSIPVWPYAEGNQRGIALKPLYPSIPGSVVKHPDELFYNLLTIVDVLRSGRARERNIAKDLLREKLKDGK